MSFSILYFSMACVAQSTASCCMSSDMSAFLITAFRSDMVTLHGGESARGPGEQRWPEAEHRQGRCPLGSSCSRRRRGLRLPQPGADRSLPRSALGSFAGRPRSASRRRPAHRGQCHPQMTRALHHPTQTMRICNRGGKKNQNFQGPAFFLKSTLKRKFVCIFYLHFIFLYILLGSAIFNDLG